MFNKRTSNSNCSTRPALRCQRLLFSFSEDAHVIFSKNKSKLQNITYDVITAEIATPILFGHRGKVERIDSSLSTMIHETRLD